jgi:predicted Zn-dependent protease
MRTWHLVTALVLVAAVGCSSNNSNKPKELTQQEQARKQWNMARAAVLYKLAKEQYDTGNLDDCRKSLDDASRMAPDNLAVRILSARVSIELGKLEAAETELQQIRAADPTNHEAEYLSGVIYQR